MAFDINYMFVPCNHRYVDDTVQLATSLGKDMIEAAPIFNNDAYMGDEYMGNDMYTYKTEISEGGSVTLASDGTLTARFPLTYRFGNSPRVFRKKPWDYQREELTAVTYTEWSTRVRYGRGHRYGLVPVPAMARYSAPILSPTLTPNTQWTVETLYDATNAYTGNEVVIKRYDPTFTYIMDYTVEQTECPHCLNKGIKNDLLFDETGKIDLVLNTKKLVQQVMKAILTLKGKNTYFPDYGTVIKELLGAKNIFLGFLIRSEIFSQLERIKKLHDNGIIASPGFYGPYETLNDLLGVEIYPTSDPREIKIKAILQTNTLERLDTQIIRIS